MPLLPRVKYSREAALLWLLPSLPGVVGADAEGEEGEAAPDRLRRAVAVVGRESDAGDALVVLLLMLLLLPAVEMWLFRQVSSASRGVKVIRKSVWKINGRIIQNKSLSGLSFFFFSFFSRFLAMEP